MSFRDTAAVATVRKLLEDKRVIAHIEPVVPARLSYGHVLFDVLDVVRDKPEIAACRRDTIVRAVRRAVSWDLSLGSHAYLFPRESPTGRGKPHLVALQSYLGKIAILTRTKMADFVIAEPIFEKEDYEIDQGTRPEIKHRRILREADRGSIIGAYAWTFVPRTLIKRVVAMPREEIDRIKLEFSDQWKSVSVDEIPWYATARVVHRLAKMIPPTSAAVGIIDDDVDDGAWRHVGLKVAA